MNTLPSMQLLTAHTTIQGACEAPLTNAAKALRAACKAEGWTSKGRIAYRCSSPLEAEGYQDKWQFSLTDPVSGIMFQVELLLTTTSAETLGRAQHLLSLRVLEDHVSGDREVFSTTIDTVFSDVAVSRRDAVVLQGLKNLDGPELLARLTDYACP